MTDPIPAPKPKLKRKRLPKSKRAHIRRLKQTARKSGPTPS